MRAAAVGAGRIAEEHLTFLQQSPDVELAAICDVSTTLSSFASRRFGGASFTDYDEMLGRVTPEVVHVLTPPHLHVRMASAALDAGAHVVVEKPMALDREEREALLDRAAEQSRVIVEDHNYRFNRPMLRLTEALTSGQLGRTTDVEVAIAMPMGEGSRYGDTNLPSPSHQLPAGFIHEFITHLCYLALTVCDDLVPSHVTWSKRLAELPSSYDSLDAALVGSGVAGRIRFTAVAPRASITVRATGTKGSAEAELIAGSLRVDRPRAVGAQLTPSANALLNGLSSVGRSVGYLSDRLQGRTAYEGLHVLLARFYRSLHEVAPPPVSPSEIRRTGDLVDDLIARMP